MTEGKKQNAKKKKQTYRHLGILEADTNGDERKN